MPRGFMTTARKNVKNGNPPKIFSCYVVAMRDKEEDDPEGMLWIMS